MIRAIRAVSIERGRDPRDYALFAFGGNGPVFACAMAKELGMRRIVVPPSPGLFSAFGLLYADVEHHYARTFRRLLRGIDLARPERGLGRAGRTGARPARRPRAFRRARCASAPRQPALPGSELRPHRARRRTARSTAALARLEEAFGQEHERTYGHRAGPEEPVELTEIRVIGQGIPERPLRPQAPGKALGSRFRTRAAAAAPRLFRPRDRLARHPGPPPDRSPRRETAPASSRNTTPPASSRPAPAPRSTLWQHPDRAVAT